MDRFYKEEDLIEYLKKHKTLDLHDMKELWRASITGVSPYHIYDCTTVGDSCGGHLIFPIKFNQTR